MNWSRVELQDVALQEKGAIVSGPFGSNISAKYFVDKGIPVIRGNNLTKGQAKFIDNGFAYITETKAAEFRNCIAMTDDIIFTAAGSIGQVGIIPPEARYAKYVISNKQLRVRLDKSRGNPNFVFAWLSSPQMVRYLENMNNGGAVPLLNLGIIRKVPVPLPPIETQHKIAEILSAYDDLIENNRRRIALLEKAAQLLYREWFVHYRFPARGQVEFVDGLPAGWERVPIGQSLIALESGGRPRGGALQSDGIASIGAENVIGLGQYDYSKEKYVPDGYFEKMRRGVIQSRDVVLYKDGAHIGRSSMFGDGFPHAQCAVNEHVFILRAKADVGQSYLYFWLSQPETRKHILNLNANTAQPGISQGKFKMLWFLLPPETLRHLFNERVEALVAQIFRLALMNRKLVEARDILLPRLMNGEITV